MNKPVIVVPYRNRVEHLPVLVKAIRKHSQAKSFPIVVAEQAEGKPFNRAKMLNIGSVIAFQIGATHVITHDVDMIPTEETSYELGDAVHLASAATQFGGKMPYDGYFGGVTCFSLQAFQSANGYSNEYWGWGAEDDDMKKRCELAGIETRRVGNNKFISLTHTHALENKDEAERMKQNGARYHKWYDTSQDGLSNLGFETLSQEELGDGVYKITVEI